MEKSYRLKDLIDMEQFQALQDRLNEIYSFPSAIIDNDGSVLTATAWQDICTEFHRKNGESEKECVKSDRYILEHLAEADPAVSYLCPHGLVDNAAPIIIDGVHLGNFFTGQFFLEEPDMEFFRAQAKKYGFDEEAYLEAVGKVPVWTKEKLNSYLFFIKGLIEVISTTGLKNLRSMESRQQAEESEKLFQAMFEMASIGIAQADPATGRWLRVNRKMCAITGYSPEEMCGLSISEITHPDDRGRVWAEFQRVVTGEVPDYRLEKRYIRKDGGVVWVNANMTVIRDAAGHPLRTIAAIEDITERKVVENDLKSSEARLAEAQSVAKVGSWETDLSSLEVVWSEETYRIFEIDSNSFYASHRAFLDFVHHEDREKVDAAFVGSVGKDSYSVIEHRIVTSGGRVKFVEERWRTFHDGQGLPVRAAGTCQDITERKEAEEYAKEEQAFSEAMIDSIPGTFYMLDAEGCYVRWNSYQRDEIVGKPEDQMAGTRAIDTIHPDDREVVGTKIESILRHGGSEVVAGRVLLRGGPEYRWLLMTGRSVIIKEKLFLVGIGIDITDQRKAEEALRLSEDRLREILNSLDGLVYVADMKTYETLFVNRYGVEVWGDFTGKTCWRSLQSGQEGPCSFCTNDRLLQPDGTPAGAHVWEFQNTVTGRWFECRDSAFRWPDGRTVRLEVAIDITERKMVDVALRESEEKFSAAFKTSPYAITITRVADGLFIEVNDAFYAMTGFTREETENNASVGMGLWVDEEDRKRVVNELFSGGKVAGWELKFRKKNGETMTGLFSAHTLHINDDTYILSSINDITERKLAEEALVASEMRFRTIIDASPVPMALNDAHQRITFLNPAFVQKFGYTLDDIPTLADWWPKAYPDIEYRQWVADTWRARIEQVKNTGVAFSPLEMTLRCKDGTAKTVLDSAAPLSNSFEGDHLVVLYDITDRKVAEAEIQKLNAELEQRVAQRTSQLESANKELEAFAYSISHDLRAPLRGIDGWSLALLEDYGDRLDAQAHIFIDRVRSETQRMGQLIDDILQLSRLTRAEMRVERVDLSTLARTIAARLQEREPGRSVEFAVQPGLNARGDPRLLEIALSNLLGNAFKFTGHTPKALIELGQTEPGGRRTFFVRDNGAGFDMAFAKKLFGAFQRMHKASEFPGTGIGLVTVQRIVHRHGGRVWAEAQVGRGATFYFTLEEDR